MFINANTGNAYSPKNTDILMLAYQGEIKNGEPVKVARFKQWLELGRVVRKGERGTKVLMVCDKKETDENGDESGRRKVCKTRTVFFESQTKPIIDE